MKVLYDAVRRQRQMSIKKIVRGIRWGHERDGGRRDRRYQTLYGTYLGVSWSDTTDTGIKVTKRDMIYSGHI